MKKYITGLLIQISFLLIQQFSQTLQDNSGCAGGQRSVTIPYMTDSAGRFVSYDVSDNYRTRSSRIFLSIQWRGERLRLVLEQHEITPTTSTAEWSESDNVTSAEHLHTEDERFYQGYVRGRRSSFAALALKTGLGLTGYIFLDGTGIFMEPIERKQSNVPTVTSHLIHSCTRHKPYTEGRGSKPQPLERKPMNIKTARYRRALPGSYTKYLEVLVVADTTVVNFVGKNKIKSYILGLMNIVNAVYHDGTLGATIEVVTVKIMYMDKAAESRVISLSDPKRTVDQFCQWASTKTYRTSYYDTSVNHDVAVLLTRSKFAPAGYAPITGMCVPMRNCALVRDDGFTSAFVIAHEVGHVFGLFHDGQGNTCYGREYSTSLMATMVQSSFHHYWWSGCSKTRMAEVLPGLRCLNNNPYETVESNIPVPVGMSWSLDEQCRLEFGDKASHCKIFPSLDPCAQLWCGDGRGTYTCLTKNVVPLDGSQCGPNKQWYCMDGSCGYHGNQPPVHGGWSGWSSWSRCSSQCGIGFKRRSRHCDNPVPEYGGKDCDGASENSDTCKSQECSEYVDMRASQCRIMDIVQVRQGTHSWKPYQADKDEDQCKLTCVSSSSGEVVTFDTLVDNGTPCTYEEPNHICLDGECIRVGCNGVRDSSVTEDSCGVCGGDGTSCKVVEGEYKKQFKYSAADGYYETVIVLPKGSRDIAISESYKSPHFLAVRDSVYYQYVLNGDGKQYPSKNFVVDGAWFRYSNNGGHEKLTSKGPVHNKVHVMIYPMDWQKPASIDFRYTVNKTDFTYEINKYSWKYEDWSPCSVSCGKGVQRIIYGCYDKESEDKVDDDKCKFLQGPDSDDTVCERISCEDLKYRWRMSRVWSSCSASCGNDGVRHQLYDCESVETEKDVDKSFCINIPEPINIEPCNIKQCTTTSYSWVVMTEWSACSATCGDTGLQYQLYYCSQAQHDGIKVKVDNLFCSDLADPKEPRPCNRLPCVEYIWVETDEWNDCSEECGDKGVQLKKVECQRSIGGDSISTVGVRHCLGLNKPSQSRSCNVRPCYSFNWSLDENWTDCSATCGNGIKTQLTVCKNTTYDNREVRVEAKHCSASERPVVTTNCTKGTCVAFQLVMTDTWTPCSAECGISGTRSKISECHQISEGTAKVVNDTFCANHSTQIQNEPCNRKPCYSFEWDIGEWSSCSQSCSTLGTTTHRARKIQCTQKYLNGQFEITESFFCDESKRPASEEKCNVPICSTFSWNESDIWSDCSVTCGNTGYQIQSLHCVENFHNGTLTPVEAKYCATVALNREPATRTCELKPCLRFRLKASNSSLWSQCSVSCGTGLQQQQVYECVGLSDDGTEEIVDFNHCKGHNLSLPQRECDMGPCAFLEWGAGEWSRCSKACGPGKRKRIVYCGDPISPSDSRMCPGKAPDEYGDCNEGDCKSEQGSRDQCNGDSAPFCRHAVPRLCQHPSYYRVCCATCQHQSESQQRPFYYRYHRRYWFQGR